MTAISTRPLCDIAAEIRTHWPNVNYAALPYLNAMDGLSSIHENYYADSARDVVARFLSNATMWRGENARRIKAELKSILAIGMT